MEKEMTAPEKLMPDWDEVSIRNKEIIKLKDQLRLAREALELAEKDITDIWQFGDTQLYDVLMKIRKTLAKMGEAGNE